jgi:hypothetical protein
MTAITVKVLYKNVDGAHFFVANDEGSTGLCVAHSDLAVAYDAVSAQLTILYKQNHDIEASFEPEMSPSAFIKWLLEQEKAAHSAPTPGIAGISGWTTFEPKLAA